MHVGVTSGRHGAQLTQALQRRGAEVLWGPTVGPDRPDRDQHVLAVTDEILTDRPDVVVASTGVGVRTWMRAATEAGRGDELAALLRSVPVAARGAKAVGALAALDVDVAFVSPVETDADVAAWLAARLHAGDCLTVQVDGCGSAGPYAQLEAAGVRVHTVAPYRCELPDDREPARRLAAAAGAGELDAVVFTSPPAARNLVTIATEAGLADRLVAAVRAGEVAAAAVGPVTATTLERAGMPVTIMPKRARTGALLQMLDAWWTWRGDALPPRLELLPDAHAVRVGTRVAVVGAIGFGVLAALVRRPCVACPLDLLMREAWGHDTPDDPSPVKHHVARLRRKLGDAGAAIQTVRGVGYRYQPAVLDSSHGWSPLGSAGARRGG